ncbi:Fc.00g088210.m01.CDS01 [Cosmosporella sp. VM-42]
MAPPRADPTKSESAYFEESLASKPFLFVVGEEKREYHVHKELVAQLSPVLNALVNGNMREAQEGRVEWLDLDIDTFVRFAKYAYSGDYTEAEPEILSHGGEVKKEGEEPVQDVQEYANIIVPHEEDEGSEISEDGDSEDGSAMESGDDDEEGIDQEDDDEEMDNEDGESGISDASSTLTNGGVWEYGPGYPSYDQMPIPSALPYSIETYLQVCKAQIRKYKLAQAEADLVYNRRHPHKRRRLEVMDYRYPPFQHDPQIGPKFGAMVRFSKVPVTKPSNPNASGQHWSPMVNTQRHQSFEPVFLSHARLYVLADKYGIIPLKALTVYRLHLTLRHFNLFEERISDLTTLVEEIYNNTVEEDPARRVVSTYFACVVEHIRTCDDFKGVLRRTGDFADDLVQHMARRLE